MLCIIIYFLNFMKTDTIWSMTESLDLCVRNKNIVAFL